MAALADPETSGIHARAILDRISSKQDGTLAAANTANRKRTVLNNLMTYAEIEMIGLDLYRVGISTNSARGPETTGNNRHQPGKPG